MSGDYHTWIDCLNAEDARFILRVQTDLTARLEKLLLLNLPTSHNVSTIADYLLDTGFDSVDIALDFHYEQISIQKGQLGSRFIDHKFAVGEHQFGHCRFGVDTLAKTRAHDTLRVLTTRLGDMTDSLLYQAKMSSIKQTLLERMRQEFSLPIFEDAATRSIAHLHSVIPSEDIVLIFRDLGIAETGDTLDYLIYYKGELSHSREKPHAGMDEILKEHGVDILDWPKESFQPFVSVQTIIHHPIESVMESGKNLGVLVFTSSHEHVTRFIRDVLRMFALGVREILNEYTRERQSLMGNFPASVVRRLLRSPNYQKNHLQAREQTLGMIYADISGFTRVSEQVLKEPYLIARLVEEWAQRMIKVLYRYDAVYDKLVGDCVIGLVGAPFFEMSQPEILQRLLQISCEFIHETQAMNQESWLQSKLQASSESSLGVAIGFNLASAFVGQIGPDKTYTALSSGMNQAARLQGLASKDEVVFPAHLAPDPSVYTPWFKTLGKETVQVKNVKEPIEILRLTPRESD